jgi:GTP-binding protein
VKEKIRVISADFLKSAQSIGDSVDESISEVVFLGRSNVGKSSTINLLTGRKNLAKSSSTPGKTQLINFFDVRYRLEDRDFRVRYVDLPGFGYARVSKSLKETWQKNLVEFIEHRTAIRLFIHLRDARHPHAQIDDEVQSYIHSFLRPDQRYMTLFTKIDKLNQKEKSLLAKEFPGYMAISNTRRRGDEQVHRKIFEALFGEES